MEHAALKTRIERYWTDRPRIPVRLQSGEPKRRLTCPTARDTCSVTGNRAAANRDEDRRTGPEMNAVESFAHTVPSGFTMNSAAFSRFASPRRNDRADHAVRKAKKRRLICSALSRTYQTICLKNCFERRSAASSHLRGESEAVFKSGLRLPVKKNRCRARQRFSFTFRKRKGAKLPKGDQTFFAFLYI